MNTLLNGLIWIAALAAWAGIFLIWNLAGLALLRSFGIDAHLHLGPRRAETNSALRRLGILGYVLVAGVMLFGWAMGAGLAVSGYIMDHWMVDAQGTVQSPVSYAHLLRDFGIWTSAGILYGLVSWKWDRPEVIPSEHAR